MLYYEVHNNGFKDWVVFIHGIGGSTNTWKKQIESFSKEYNLLLIDLPGHGKSESLPKVSIKSVNQLIKEVLDKECIKQADFVSMSLGTLVAAHFAISYPGMVRSLVFGGAIINVEGISKFLVNTANCVKHILPHRLLYNMFARVMLPKKKHAKSRKIFIRESKKMKRKDFMEWVDYLQEIAHPKKLLEKLKNINIKMYFISGDEDVCFLSGIKKATRKFLPKSQLDIIQDCGHVCTIEKYKEFNTKALCWLRQIHQPVAA